LAYPVYHNSTMVLFWVTMYILSTVDAMNSLWEVTLMKK